MTLRNVCGLLNEGKLPLCGEIIFDKMYFFLFWRGPVDEEQIKDCGKVSKEFDRYDCLIFDKDLLVSAQRVWMALLCTGRS